MLYELNRVDFYKKAQTAFLGETRIPLELIKLLPKASIAADAVKALMLC